MHLITSKKYWVKPRSSPILTTPTSCSIMAAGSMQISNPTTRTTSRRILSSNRRRNSSSLWSSTMRTLAELNLSEVLPAVRRENRPIINLDQLCTRDQMITFLVLIFPSTNKLGSTCCPSWASAPCKSTSISGINRRGETSNKN